MRPPDVILDTTNLSVRQLTEMTGVAPSVWIQAVADDKVGRPFLRSGAYLIRALDAVRFLKASKLSIPDSMAGVDRVGIVYCHPEGPDRVVSVLAKLSKLIDLASSNSVAGALWLAGRYLPQVVVLPLSTEGCTALRAIQDRGTRAVGVLIGPAPKDSVAAACRLSMQERDVMFLETPELRPICELLRIPAEYMEAL